jgi:peptidyl-prolyl cis-trans isomerase D
MEKTRNFILLLFAVVMVLSLIIAGSLTRDNASVSTSPGSTETAAAVGSEKITVGELAALKQGQMGTLPSKFMLNSRLIPQRIMRLEANRLGLRASDAEVAGEIRKQLKTEDGTVIDQKRYEESMTRDYGSVAAYEQIVRDQLSGQKLEAFLTSGVTVSEEEILTDFQRKNTKFDVNYVSVSVPDLAQAMKPTDQELVDYFEKNKANYYINAEQKKIRYIFLNTSKVGEKMPLPDEELRGEYDKIPADKRTKGVEAQQIVLRVPKPEFKAQTLEKANQLAQTAKKDGGTISEEAFADLVRGYSEDAATKATGGKLPTLVRDNPNLANNPNAVPPPQQTVLRMKEGEVSEPVESGNAFVIYRRGKEIPKTFEDAKPELEVSLRNRKAYAVTAELAQKVVEDLKQTKDVQATANKFAGQANMSASEMIRETPFVKPGDNVENIGVSPQFEEGIKNLSQPNDVGERTPIQNGFAIPLLVERRDPRDATFEEVKAQVTESMKLEKARAQVEEIAKQIAASANGTADLSNAATAKGLKVQEQKAFILGSPLGQGPTASTSEALENAVYALKPGEVAKTPFKVGDNWVIVGVTNREDASMDEFGKQREQLTQTALQEKRATVFSDYIGAVRQKMEKDGDIKIYNEVIEKLDAETQSTNPQMPQFPFPAQ